MELPFQKRNTQVKGELINMTWGGRSKEKMSSYMEFDS